MSGLIARKLGMTRVVTETGDFVPATVLEVADMTVAQVKMPPHDNVRAIVLSGSFASRKKPILKQFRVSEDDAFEKGQTISLDGVSSDSVVELTSISKGKGFQGVMFRHNFGGGRATHGGKYRRAPGSIGTRKPTKVYKGRKMPGHMGVDQITLKKVPVLDVVQAKRLLVVKGPVPGAIDSIVYITLS
ncbi:50S ribosomal protein L3 [Candidatus Gracilibacteria bacterium CG17_big_fil_post_rev_8_21_14_2_50_48_13]|nr:MAG: 50S ribosomal protein L3 [Candidatus Gracilibacteria bacterium CG17_big_fil_post_rev_8_21_14_2_50_48_13]